MSGDGGGSKDSHSLRKVDKDPTTAQVASTVSMGRAQRSHQTETRGCAWDLPPLGDAIGEAFGEKEGAL